MPRNISVESIDIFIALWIFKHCSKLETSGLKFFIAYICMNASGSLNNKFREWQFYDVVLNFPEIIKVRHTHGFKNKKYKFFILVSYGCHGKVPQTEWLKTTEIYSHGSGN